MGCKNIINIYLALTCSAFHVRERHGLEAVEVVYVYAPDMEEKGLILLISQDKDMNIYKHTIFKIILQNSESINNVHKYLFFFNCVKTKQLALKTRLLVYHTPH